MPQRPGGKGYPLQIAEKLYSFSAKLACKWSGSRSTFMLATFPFTSHSLSFIVSCMILHIIKLKNLCQYPTQLYIQVSSLIVGAADRFLRAADRDLLPNIQEYGVSLPLTIQSPRIVLYGAEGIAVVGMFMSLYQWFCIWNSGCYLQISTHFIAPTP